MLLLRKLLRLDWILLLVIVALCIMGVTAIRSVTAHSDNAGLRASADLQLHYYLPLGLAAFFIASLVDYRRWVAISPYLFGVMIIALVLVIIPGIGTEINDSRSWFVFGPVRLQPAEIFKLTFIILMGAFLNWCIDHGQIKRLWVFLAVGAIASFSAGLILLQPDFGSAAVLFPIAFVIMFVGGVRLFFLALPVALVAAVIGWSYYIVYKQDITSDDQWAFKLKTYQLNRIKIFYDPTKDTRDSGWQINQSLIAIGSGGFRGKGIGQGTQNTLGYLPRESAHNDFIFAVVGEEAGFVGGATIIVLEALILLACLRVAFASGDPPGSLIAVGVMAMLFTHIFVNIGMTIQVVPITGIPLPFISYGGTFLVACLAGLGLVQSVWIHRKPFLTRPA
jgi:rod shape determining protein RodA